MISSRYIQEQSWWLASELCRRNPRMRIYLHYPYEGQFDSLLVYDSTDPESGIFAEINRNGSIHVDGRPHRVIIGWDEVFSAQSALDIVERIEREWGEPVYQETEAAVPAIVTYRTISQLLTTNPNARRPWEVVMGYVDSTGIGWEPDYYASLNVFPHRDVIRRNLESQDFLYHPMEYAWLVSEGSGTDADVRMLLDDEGNAYSRAGEVISLTQLLRSTGSIQTVVGQILPHKSQ